jgi:hypothetical protein
MAHDLLTNEVDLGAWLIPRLGFHPIFQRQHCDLGLYNPTEEQVRLLLPSTSQLQPEPSLAPLPQLREQTAACVIKVTSVPVTSASTTCRGNATTTRPKSTRAKGNASSAPNKKPLVLVGEK